MAETLREEPVDVAHFISPGHFNGERGAIVLAGRPDANVRHGDVIGSAELAPFLDRIGCGAMAFSSPDMPQWVAGQRALAFELSWLRPGPIMLSERPIREENGFRAVFGNLFGAAKDLSRKLGEAEPFHLCLHPELIAGTAPPPKTEWLGPERGSPSTASGKMAESYVRNLGASLTETRDLAPSEQWERDGAREALNFLTDIVGRRERF
jgi:hypothetical protein